MKKMKRGTALLLALVMAASLTTTALIAANKNWVTTGLGDLSQYYETGNSADPGYISTVDGDSGGTSYGLYMFVESTVIDFMNWLRKFETGSTARTMGEQLYNAYAYRADGTYYPGIGSNFRNTWKQIAANNRTEFGTAQTEFWKTQCYDKLLANVKTLFPSFNIDDYSIALKNVFWSRSVQHGVGVTSGANSSDGKSGATAIIYRAFTNRLGGFKNQSEAELIAAIYAECSKLDASGTYREGNMENLTASKYGIKDRSMTYFSANSGGVQTAVYSRLHVNEPSDALVMRYSNTNPAVAEGKYLLLSNNANQSLALSVTADGATAVEAKNGTALTLTYYNSGKYTLSAADGTRLADVNGTVKLVSPAVDNSQFWTIENGKLKNVSTGKYLHHDSATNGTYAVAADVSAVSSWQLSPLTGASGWTTVGLFYPGSTDSDGIGNTVNHNLTEGNASFPLRGIISHPKGIQQVVVTVKNSNGGSGGFITTARVDGATWFDLWELDKTAKFTGLAQGTYTLTISATSNGGGSDTLVSSSFTVGARDTSITTGGNNDTYTVTFINGSTKTTRTYTLGETYGELPSVTTEGFKGWFTADGTEISSNSIVAAENHTVTAQYGDLHTVTFISDGVAVKTARLAEGSLITAPATPVKGADSDYVYSFKYWQDASGNRFVSGATYMGGSDITYTAVFGKSANTGTTTPTPGTEAPTPSGDYLTGISPNTSVSTLTDAGYTVYSGSTAVTSGLVGTGMVATNGSASVTIVVTGDVSGDGKITITDVVKLQSDVAGASSLSGAYAQAGDINGDGKVTITDVVQAAQITVGQRSLG